MQEAKVKIIDKKTGATKEVKKSLVGDYIGTGKFEVFDETQKKRQEKPSTKSDFYRMDN